MLHTISGDVTTLSGSFILCQQVNCQAVMGAGLVLSIRKKWPQVYSDYITFCHSASNKQQLLGCIQTTTVGQHQFICNIFGQYRYGHNGHFTNEQALLSALNIIFKHAASSKLPVFVPSRIGSGLAGGDINTIQQGIRTLANKTHANVYLVNYSANSISIQR